MALAQSELDRRRRIGWQPPAALLARARAAPWRGDPQPQVTAQVAIGPGVVWLGRTARERFAGLITQTYARGRTLLPGQRSSMHHAGRAIDLMIAEVHGGADPRGDDVAAWLLENASAMGVQYFIWKGTQWSSATGNVSVYPGTESHENHIHVDLSGAGALARLPWYADIDPPLLHGRSMDTAPVGVTTVGVEDPTPDLTITPAEAGIAPATSAPTPAGAGLAGGVALVGAGFVGFKLGQRFGWWR